MGTDKKSPTPYSPARLKAVESSIATSDFAGQGDSAGQVNLDFYDLSEVLKKAHVVERQIREELRQADVKNAALENEIHGLKSLKLEHHQLQSENQNLRAELAQLKGSLREQTDRLKSAMLALEQERSSASEERKSWAKRFEANSSYSDEVLRKYNELYQYCQSLLDEAKARREDLEENLKTAREKIEQLTKQLDETRINLAKMSKQESLLSTSRKELDWVLTDIQRRELELNQVNEKLRTQTEALSKSLEDARRGETHAKLECAQMEARLQSASEGVLVRGIQLSKARDLMSSSLRIIEGLLRSTREFMKSASSGSSPMALKAGTIIAEQWKIEIENLRRIDFLLSEIISTQSKSN